MLSKQTLDSQPHCGSGLLQHIDLSAACSRKPLIGKPLHFGTTDPGHFHLDETRDSTCHVLQTQYARTKSRESTEPEHCRLPDPLGPSLVLFQFLSTGASVESRKGAGQRSRKGAEKETKRNRKGAEKEPTKIRRDL